MTEAVALELVEADLDHAPDGRGLLEPGVAPAARLGEAPVGRVPQQRLDARVDLGLVLGRDGRRANVAELAVVLVGAQQERGDLPILFQRTPATTQSAVRWR